MATEKFTQQSPEALVQASRAMFGEVPSEVLNVIDTGADTMRWLREIFNSIAKEAGEHTRIATLANAGSYLAEDFSNYLDCRREDMEDNLKLAGVVVNEPSGSD